MHIVSYLIGYEINDLDGYGLDFQAQASQWTDTGLLAGTTSNIFTCNGTTDLVGGYRILNNQPGKYFQRIYTDLPAHNMIYYSFTFWMFDSWDLTDSLDIDFDSVIVNGWQFVATRFPGMFLCGNPAWRDMPNITIVGRVAHISDSLTIRMVSGLNDNSWDESFGFRDVRLIFLNRTENETAEACVKGSVSMVTKECPCTTKYYLDFYSNETCTGCSSNCASCFGPNPADCYQCVDGYSLIGQDCIQCSQGCRSCHGSGPDQCDVCNTDKFHYWNNSCLDSCDFPLTQISISEADGIQECTYPCSSSEYLYWNRSCLPSCEGAFIPREESGVWFCDFPCDDDEFLYWDGSCYDNCSDLLIPSTDHSKKFCNSPCTDPTEFIFSNNTCQSSCPSPFQSNTNSETPAKYCDSPCLPDQFYYWNSTCSNTCDYPLTSGIEGVLKYCDYKCLNDPTEFLSWDGNCVSSCDPPLSQKVNGAVKFCYFSCPGGGYLYWDGYCSSVCEFPLTQREIATTEKTSKFCDFDCQNNTDFLYWDGSCSSSCPSPLVANSYHSRQFCTYPCDSTDDFIYPNNTCQPACPSPYKTRIEDAVKYCDLPCSEEEFLYWNGTCIDTCKSPLSISITDDVQFCDYLCDNQKYLFWDGSCITACKFPLLSYAENGQLFCNLPCSSPYEYYYEETGECSMSCTLPNIIKSNSNLYFSCGPPDVEAITDGNSDSSDSLTGAGSATGTIMNTAILIDTVTAVPTEPTTVVLILYVKILQYIRYLDIGYPIELQNMLARNGNSPFILNFGPGISSGIKTAFQNSSIPSLFERYHLQSSFLVDIWKIMTTLLIVLGVIAAIFVFERTHDRFHLRHWRAVTDQIKVVLRWNFVLIIFISNIDEIILYSSLEFRTLNINSFQAFISLLICLFMLALVPAPMIGSYYLAKTTKQQRIKSLAEGSQLVYTRYVRKWQGFQVLWSGFKDDITLRQLFLAIYIARITLAYLIVSYLYASPLLQTIFYLILSIGILIYIIKGKPLKKKLNQIQTCAYEIISLLVNLCLLILAALDKGDANAKQLRIFLGNIIIFCHLALNVISIVFLVVKIGVRLGKMYKLHKIGYRFGKRGCFQLFLLPLQQITMGFEKIILPQQPIEIQVTPVQKEQRQEIKSDKTQPKRKSIFSLSSERNLIGSLEKVPDSNSVQQTPKSSRNLLGDPRIRARLKALTLLAKRTSIEPSSSKVPVSEPCLEDTNANKNNSQAPQTLNRSLVPESPLKMSKLELQKDIDTNLSPSKEMPQNLDLDKGGLTPKSLLRGITGTSDTPLILSPKENSGVIEELKTLKIEKDDSPTRSHFIQGTPTSKIEGEYLDFSFSKKLNEADFIRLHNPDKE